MVTPKTLLNGIFIEMHLWIKSLWHSESKISLEPLFQSVVHLLAKQRPIRHRILSFPLSNLIGKWYFKDFSLLRLTLTTISTLFTALQKISVASALPNYDFGDLVSKKTFMYTRVIKILWFNASITLMSALVRNGWFRA